MYKGKVKWFNDAKGFGFLESTELNKDVFCHFGAIQGNGHKSLTEGQAVEFECEASPKGIKATKVFLVEDGLTRRRGDAEEEERT